MNRPSMEARLGDVDRVGRGDASVVSGFQFGGRDHADLAVGGASVVEPVDVLQCGQFEIVEPMPGTVGADEFGLEQSMEAFG